MLNIRNVQHLPDGRSVLDTVGGQRFRVLSKRETDGYHTAKVEFVKDVRVEEHARIGACLRWFYRGRSSVT